MKKYQVKKHRYLPTAIIRFPTKTVIMPEGIECDSDTTLDDIEIIEDTFPELISPQFDTLDEQTWTFKSSSSDGIYTVRKTINKIKCDCPGVWRSKDKRCKHIKEVEKELGILE
jgi:hypothetical protein